MAVNTEPAWYQKWLKKETPTPVLTTSPEQNSITLTCGPSGEMLRVAEDGFYVRGKRVPVDDKESLAVYNAFSEWLNWQILNRDQR
jgi:hypothetical protein